MEPVIDLEKAYGVVLEGGGARGAYQVGAWRALWEAGVKIRGIAGTSVGALNGALMCMGDLDLAESVWGSLTYSQVMDVENEKMKSLMDHDMPFWEALGQVFQTMGEGGLDVTPLKELLMRVVDEDRIRNSPMELFIKTFRLDQMKELDIDLKQVEPGTMKDFLLASAYIFPLFKNEKLLGGRYIDGGAVNNVPLDSLVNRGYRDILMIRIYGIGRNKKIRLPEETDIITIEPRVSLGNIIDFDPVKSRRNMKIGYYDAKRTIYGLKGHIYYIEENQEECYYLKQLLQISPDTMEELQRRRRGRTEEAAGLRRMVEETLPGIAAELHLGRDWDYRELYLGCLEVTARLCRVPKYRIYTVEELEAAVKRRLASMEPQRRETLPAFSMLFS